MDIQNLKDKGNHLALSGKHKQALTFFQKGLEAAEGVNDPEKELQFKRSLAFSNYSIGRYERACELYKELVKIDKKNHSHEDIGWDYFYLGEISKNLSLFDEAELHYKQGIKFFSKKGNRHLGLPLSALGRLYYTRRQFIDAAKMVLQHFTHTRSIHFDESYGLSYITFGLLLFTKDDALNKIIHKINKVLNKKPSPFECFYTAIKLSRENNYLETELVALKVASLYYSIMGHSREAGELDIEFDHLIKKVGKKRTQKEKIIEDVTALFYIHQNQ